MASKRINNTITDCENKLRMERKSSLKELEPNTQLKHDQRKTKNGKTLESSLLYNVRSENRTDPFTKLIYDGRTARDAQYLCMSTQAESHPSHELAVVRPHEK